MQASEGWLRLSRVDLAYALERVPHEQKMATIALYIVYSVEAEARNDCSLGFQSFVDDLSVFRVGGHRATA